MFQFKEVTQEVCGKASNRILSAVHILDLRNQIRQCLEVIKKGKVGLTAISAVRHKLAHRACISKHFSGKLCFIQPHQQQMPWLLPWQRQFTLLPFRQRDGCAVTRTARQSQDCFRIASEAASCLKCCDARIC